jgi:phosphoribosylanthranilate isomerase
MDDEPAFIAEAIATVRPDLHGSGGEEAPDCALRTSILRSADGQEPKCRGATDGREQPRAQVVTGVPSSRPQAAGFCLTATAGEQGGSGKLFDWAQLPASLSAPVILAGGLTPENVGQAIRTAQPYAVDVSTGIESAPGMKDMEKMRRFVTAVRSDN